MKRQLLVGAGAVGGLAVLTQLVLPGTSGGGRGTPAAILFQGLILGLVGALPATGIVVVYRSVRVVNFAQGVLGAAGGYLVFDFIRYTRVPFVAARVLGLALSAAVGLVLGVFALRFARAPRLVLTVLTILAAATITGFSGFVQELPFFPDAAERDFGDAFVSGSFRGRLPFSGFEFFVGGLELPFGYAEILAAQVAVACLVGVGLFLRYARSGIAVRAVAENAERASLLGVGVGRLTCAVWTIAGLLSGAAVILTGVLAAPEVALARSDATILLPALAAAVVGRMRSLPVTVVAAVGIAVASSAWEHSYDADRGLFTLGLFAVVAAGLFLQRSRLTRSEQSEESTSWSASTEQRPIPAELAALPSVRWARRLLVGAGLVVAVAYPFAVGTGATNLGAVIAVDAIVVVSLVVLTGWAGQVSLGQFGFAAVGAVIGGALTSTLGVPFWLAVPLAAVLVAGFAALVGLPALRIRGLFLLVVTFAFAVAVEAVLFDERYFGWVLVDTVERPTFFFVNFEDERSMYYLCLAALVLAIAGVTSLRRTRIGRLLLAVRDNEAGLRSFGVSALRMKLLAFAISGGLAGFAGAILAHQQRGLNGATFGANASVNVFVQGVFGGIGSVGGALVGTAYFNAVDYATTSPLLAALAGPFLTLALLYAAPGGVVSLLNAVRTTALALFAHRQGIVVPSLVPDYDPLTHDRRLMPLGERLGRAGLAALGLSRFTLASKYHDPPPPVASAPPSTVPEQVLADRT